MRRVAVLGASGFIGRSVSEALVSRDAEVRPITSPRLTAPPERARTAWRDMPKEVAALADRLRGSEVVICCAGNPDASSQDLDALFGVNAALPGVAAAAAEAVGSQRYVHVSSAAVQGAAPRLDATMATHAFSPYAQSKIVGELSVQEAPHPSSTVIYRPPSVHSAERRVTKGIRRLARSPLASVVGPGDVPTPQAHIKNVADAIAELALIADIPPRIVIHPWEGWTTGDLMRVFGSGHEPLHIPAVMAPSLRRILRAVARLKRLAPHARRVEMMWFGQLQDESWLTGTGWHPPVTRAEWSSMIDEMNRRNSLTGVQI